MNTQDNQNQSSGQQDQLFESNDQEQTAVNRPVDVQHDGNLKATTWQNDGEHGSYYSTTFSKVYQDDQGNFREGKSFTGTDLLKLSMLAQSSYARTNELRREQDQAHDPGQNKKTNTIEEADEGTKQSFKEKRTRETRRSRSSKAKYT